MCRPTLYVLYPSIVIIQLFFSTYSHPILANSPRKSSEIYLNTGEFLGQKINMEDHIKFVAPTLPLDSEGYCQSFTYDQTEEIKHFFDIYGFVVVRSILPEENIKATLADVFRKARVNPTRPESWLTLNWNEVFESKYNAMRGFLGYDYALSQAAWNNRQLPSVHQAFQAIFNQRNLWVKMDRYGFMRPTRGLTASPTFKVDKVDWETERNWVHWDQNPWLEPEFCRVQALFTLTDHTSISGGFHCIPGFTHYFKKYAEVFIGEREDNCLINFSDNEIKKKIHHENPHEGRQPLDVGLADSARKLSQRGHLL